MALRLIYQVFSTVLGWIVLRARPETSKEIEILALRHQLAVLQRRTPRPPLVDISDAPAVILRRFARFALPFHR